MTHVLLHQAGDMEQKLWNFYQVSVPHVSDPGDMKKKTLWNFYQDSVPRVSDPGDMEQKLWNFYQDSVPHVSDSGDMEQSSETSIKTLFHMFRIPAIWNKVLKP